MDGPKTTLVNLKEEGKNKDFSFDYSFWSHDGFETKENGFMVPLEEKYADQQKVYETVGV